LRVSVIIPALDEMEDIAACVASAQAAGAWEVIVADGGSRDGTPQLAARLARVVYSPPGRARQMNAGAQLASGEVLLFLHADSRLPLDGLAAVSRALARGRAPGGVFHLTFEPATPLLKFFAWFTRLPFRLLHYGDAGIFVRRRVFESLGGYRNLELMEDLDLWLRLRRVGRPVILKPAVVTSSRRYLRHGALRQQALSLWLTLLWLGGADHRKLARRYYGRAKA